MHDFKLLKQTVSIHQVLTARGLGDRFKKRGDRLIGPCPIHAGDNPNAFVVSLSRDLWHCFSRCGRGGDVIDLVRSLDNLTYAQAGSYLASLASLPPPTPPRPLPQPPPRKPFVPFTKTLSLDPTAPLLRRKRINPSTASLFEVGAYYGPGFLHTCIGVRLHDPSGQPLGYAGRRLLDQDATLYGKWKLPPGLPKSTILYGFHRVVSSTTTAICVVECPWGVMRLHQLGIPAVALLGSTLSSTQRHLLQRTPRIVLLLDGDAAGRQAAHHIHSTLRSLCDVYVATLPDGLDPDDLDDADLRHLFQSTALGAVPPPERGHGI